MSSDRTPKTSHFSYDEVLVACSSKQHVLAVWKAASEACLTSLRVSCVNELVLELLRRETCSVVVDTPFVGDGAKEALGHIRRIRPHAHVFLIARNLDEARNLGVDIGVHVRHLFANPPSVEHLKEFLILARRAQESRLADEEQGLPERSPPALAQAWRRRPRRGTADRWGLEERA